WVRQVELHAMLKQHEKGLPKKVVAASASLAIKRKKNNKKKKPLAAQGKGHGIGKDKVVYSSKLKISPPPKTEHPAKDAICHHCGEVGHWRRNCLVYLFELIKKNKTSGASTSCVFVIEHYSFTSILGL
nr:zinc finger, CCHC-type [Tanacetum cinerariifolium]